MKRNRLRWGSIALVLMASYWEAPKVSAHGVPALVTSAGDQLAIIGLIPVGEFVDDGFDIYADAPGFGINFSSVGPPAGTELLFMPPPGVPFYSDIVPIPGGVLVEGRQDLPDAVV